MGDHLVHFMSGMDVYWWVTSSGCTENMTPLQREALSTHCSVHSVLPVSFMAVEGMAVLKLRAVGDKLR